MKSDFDRFIANRDATNGFADVAAQWRDQHRWRGLHLEEWLSEGGELEETQLTSNGLVLNLARATPQHSYSEVRWSGHHPQRDAALNGAVSFFPAGIPYSVRAQGSFHALVLAIDPVRVSEAAAALGRGHHSLLRPGVGINDPFVAQSVIAMARDIRSGYPYGAMYGEALGAALVAHVTGLHSRNCPAIREDADRGPMCRAEVLEFVDCHLDSDLSLAEISAFMGTDIYSTTRWFKKNLGMPPHQFVLHHRVMRAETLLRSTDLPLTEIAMRCGFYSHSHFTTTFRRHRGVAPNEFRATARG